MSAPLSQPASLTITPDSLVWTSSLPRTGLFAKLGVLEVSAEKSICQQCTDFYCLKGGHEKAGCPIYNQPSKVPDRLPAARFHRVPLS